MFQDGNKSNVLARMKEEIDYNSGYDYVCKMGKYAVMCFTYSTVLYNKSKVYVACIYETGEPRAVWGSRLREPYAVDYMELTKLMMLVGE